MRGRSATCVLDLLADVAHNILGLLGNVVCSILGLFGYIVRGVLDLLTDVVRDVLDLLSGIVNPFLHLVTRVRHELAPDSMVGITKKALPRETSRSGAPLTFNSPPHRKWEGSDIIRYQTIPDVNRLLVSSPFCPP